MFDPNCIFPTVCIIQWVTAPYPSNVLSLIFSESWISKILDIIDFSKSSLFIHFRRTSESAWMKMHLLCSDEKAWSQRPLDGVRAGQRNGHIFFTFWAVLGTRTQCGYEEFMTKWPELIFITGYDSCNAQVCGALFWQMTCPAPWYDLDARTGPL